MNRRPFLRLLMPAALLAATLGAGCASMTMPASVKVNDGVLTGANGMTLYTFDRDAAGSGKSVCNGACATNWPPLLAGDYAQPSGDFSIVVRDDGQKQIAHKGKPLYFWSKDAKPGDRTGDGFNNAWRLARP
ncbi:COG4315 family predicted lipoprotein [Hydrogenophaga aquatica]